MQPQRVSAKAQSAASVTAAGRDTQSPGLRLALFDSVGLPESVIIKIQQRVEEIFEQIGVVIEWHEPSSVSNGDEPYEPYYLKVILFDKEPAAMGHPADAMGISFVTDEIPDAVWLFDPVIRGALKNSGRRSRPLSSEELGRAYGRVLAHEVVHAFANDMRHADSGLMAPAQNRNVLISARTAVDAGSEAAFLAGLARVAAGNVVSGQ